MDRYNRGELLMTKKRKVIITGIALAAALCIGTAGFMLLSQTEETPAETNASDSTTEEITATVAAELPAVESIHAENLALVLNGEASANLNATAETDTLPDGAQIVFDYAASNESITVDTDGTVTAQAVSAVVPFVTITAKYDADGDGVADSNTVLATQKVQVSVSLVAERIELSMVNVMIYVFPYLGIESDALQLVTTVLPEGTTTTYTYSSSDENIATVTENGIISALAEGTATITVTSKEGLTADCGVTVSRAPADINAQEEAEAAAA